MDWPALLGEEWAEVLKPVLEAPDWWPPLWKRLEAERAKVLPPTPSEWFAALRACPPARTRWVLLAEEPYPTRGHAHGYAFSVDDRVRPVPGSLQNIYRELHACGHRPPPTGDLRGWAQQGVLLLNSVLTVREGDTQSHHGWGWERLTQAALAHLGQRPTAQPIVYFALGRTAQRTLEEAGVNPLLHVVLRAAHPSPKVEKGFLGSGIFRGQADLQWAQTYDPQLDTSGVLMPLDPARALVYEEAAADAMDVVEEAPKPSSGRHWWLYGQPGVAELVLARLEARQYCGYVASRRETATGGRFADLDGRLTELPPLPSVAHVHDHVLRLVRQNTQGALLLLDAAWREREPEAYRRCFLEPLLALPTTVTVILQSEDDALLAPGSSEMFIGGSTWLSPRGKARASAVLDKVL